jgi:TfdA family taurine catabolism dioxygenase TauD
MVTAPRSNVGGLKGARTVLDTEIRGPQAWTGTALGPDDWLLRLPRAAVDELDTAVAQLRRDPLPLLMLEPGQFALAACREAMGRVRAMLDAGVGLAVVDGVPVERYSVDESRAVGWLLSGLLGRTVAQKWDGTMIYDVRDTGQALGYGVRRSVTNLELLFHSDGPWLDAPPDLVGLLCLNPAREGGVSRFVSLVTVHNEIRRRHPRLLPRLYRPFCWDAQAEHHPDAPRFARQPVFSDRGGSLVGRLNAALIATGHALAGEPLDAEGEAAVAAVQAIADAPALWVEFTIQRGQLQFLNNLQFAHSRTDFRDADDAAMRRHLIRYWTREAGRRTFHA